MAALGRIGKNLGAAITARALTILTQVVLPPIFVRGYGVAGFGEWGVLSGAVGALSILNFGVQTFVNQDLAVRLARGESSEARIRQSTALRLLIGVVSVAALLGLAVFTLPIDSWLRLDIGAHAAQTTAYLLGLQVLCNILLGFLTGSFLAVQRAHRGAQWSNANVLLGALLLIAGVGFHLPFAVLAATQVAALLVSIAFVLVDLWRTAPAIFPTLGLWDGEVARDLLKPSGYFGLISLSTFLTYQLPLVILQRAVGPVAVAAFLVMRTLFSMCRQVLATLTQSLSTEITALFGRRDYAGLLQLYEYSERLVFFLIPVVNAGTLLMSPLLVTVWMHRRTELFSPGPYCLAAAISMVISLKEHKYQFQASTNTHQKLALVMFFGYGAMAFASFAVVPVAGVVGFLWVWFATEMLQMMAITQLNVKLFARVGRLRFDSLWRLVVLCGGGIGLGFLVLTRLAASAIPLQGAATLVVVAGIAVVAFRAFGMSGVLSLLRTRLLRRAA